MSQNIITSTSSAVIIIPGHDFNIANLKSQIDSAVAIPSFQKISVKSSWSFLRALLKVSPAEGNPKFPQIPVSTGRCVALLEMFVMPEKTCGVVTGTFSQLPGSCCTTYSTNYSSQYCLWGCSTNKFSGIVHTGKKKASTPCFPIIFYSELGVDVGFFLSLRIGLFQQSGDRVSSDVRRGC